MREGQGTSMNEPIHWISKVLYWVEESWGNLALLIVVLMILITVIHYVIVW
jgi:hypothetical protein